MDTSYYHEYATFEDHHWWFRGRRAVIRSLLRRWLPLGERRRILDVGCGTGAMLELLDEFGEVEGIDLSADAVAYCRQRLGHRNRLHVGRIEECLPTAPPYDVITAFDVLEHIADPLAALRNIRAAVQPGGLFICTVPAFSFLWGPHDDVNHHYRRYTHRSLKEQLVAAEFRLQWMSYFNLFLLGPIAAIRLIRRLCPSRGRARSDLRETPWMIDSLTGALFSSERHLLPVFRLPIGVSLVAIARV